MIEYLEIAGALLAAGAYLKWALGPVFFAFDVGRQVGRVLGRDEAHRNVADTLDEMAAVAVKARQAAFDDVAEHIRGIQSRRDLN